MASQCLRGCRIGELEVLQSEIAACRRDIAIASGIGATLTTQSTGRPLWRGTAPRPYRFATMSLADLNLLIRELAVCDEDPCVAKRATRLLRKNTLKDRTDTFA